MLPVPEGVGGDVRSLERILHEVEDLLQAQRGERLGPDAHRAVRALLGEDVLVVALPHADEQAVVVGVEEIVAGALRAVVVADGARHRREELRLVVAVEMNLVVRAVGRRSPLRHLPTMSGSPAMAQSVGIQSLWLMSSLVTVPGLMWPGQRTRQGTRNAPSQLVFFSERNGVIAPSGQVFMCGPLSVRVDDDRVVGDAHVVERLEQRADGVVVLDHAVDVFAVAVLVAAAMLRPHVRAQVHARAVPPAEERLARGVLPLHVVDRGGGGFVVDRLHPLLGQRAGVLDRLLADLAEPRIDGRIVHVGGLALEHAARAELGAIGRVLRIVGQFRLFFGVEVIEVAEELVEAVDRRQRSRCGRRRGSCRIARWRSRGSSAARRWTGRAGSCPSVRPGSRPWSSPVRMTVLAGEKRRAARRCSDCSP